MNVHMNILRLTALLVLACFIPASTLAFEGRITATVTQGGQTSELLYTAGRDQLRIENADTNRPHARNLVQLKTGDLTLLFPRNRSFVRLKAALENAPTNTMPGLPPGNGTDLIPRLPSPASIGSANVPGMSQMPALPDVGFQAALPSMDMPSMPMPPPMPEETVELRATGETTNVLGYACQKWELRHQVGIMEIWATDQLLPFQNYVRNQPRRFGLRMLEERWSGLVRAKKLFPLLAVLRSEGVGERLRFEVRSIQPGKIGDKDDTLFQPPPDYHEIEPLPF